MLDAEITAEILQTINHPTRVARLAAYRAGKTLDDCKAAMQDADSRATWQMYEDSANAAKAAQSANRLAYEYAYNSAALIGLHDSAAHELALKLSTEAREYASEATTYAAIHLKAHRMSLKAQADYSAKYN